MDQIIFWAGRFHPVFVHLPTALLPFAALLYFLSRVERFKKLESTVTPLLLVGVLGAAASVASGLSIAESGDYDTTLLDRHKWMGIASTILGLLALFLRIQGKPKKIESIILFLLLLLITLTGHWGGILTHGENWFSIEAPAPQNDVLDKLKTIPISNTSQARLYQDLVPLQVME